MTTHPREKMRPRQHVEGRVAWNAPQRAYHDPPVGAGPPARGATAAERQSWKTTSLKPTENS